MQAALFDLDGTLVHSSIDFDVMKRAIRALAAKCAIDPQSLVARDVLGLVREACDRAAPELRAKLALECDAAILEEEERAARDARPDPDAANVLHALRASGRKLGIVTRNTRPIAARLLQRFELAFDVLVAREDTPRPKPAPIHLRRALVALRTPPRAAIFVGDHAMDALGGRRAGVRTFGVPTPGDDSGHAFAAARPDVMLTRLGELLDHLGD